MRFKIPVEVGINP